MVYALNLDHIFSTFPEDHFDQIRNLPEILPNTEYLLIAINEQFSYQGIYIRTQDGHYVALVDDRPWHGFRSNGYAFSCFDSPFLDYHKLDAMLPHDLSYERSQSPNIIPEAVTEYPSFEEEGGYDWYYSWEEPGEGPRENRIFILDYFKKQYNWPYVQLHEPIDEKFVLKQITEVRMALSTGEYSLLEKRLGWLGTLSVLDQKQTEVLFNNPNGNPVRFVFDQFGNRRTGIRSITFEKAAPIEPEVPPELNTFAFQSESKQLVMRFQEY